jgi:serine O-acetyltransferase
MQATAEPMQGQQGFPGIWGALRAPGFVLSSRNLWLLSIAVHRAGYRRLAKAIKYFNAMLYCNSLPPDASSVSPDVGLGHHGFGTVVHPKVIIGRHVKIFHGVTISVRPPDSTHHVVIEDGVTIGANSVVMTPRNRGIRIGRRSRVGAGAVVTHDVPPETLAVSPSAELRPREQRELETPDED